MFSNVVLLTEDTTIVERPAGVDTYPQLLEQGEGEWVQNEGVTNPT